MIEIGPETRYGKPKGCPVKRAESPDLSWRPWTRYVAERKGNTEKHSNLKTFDVLQSRINDIPGDATPRSCNQR
jgi:hypothetical protein